MTINGSSMKSELNTRLDALFDEDLSRGESAKQGAPLETLKAIILEMEWEIADKNLDAYLRELQLLGGRCRNDKALSIYIKLLDTIGRYLKAKKAASHPETVSFLKSLFDSFEVAVSSGMTESEKNRLAAGHVAEFKRFKAAISAQPPSKSSAVAPQSPPPAEVGSGLSEEVKAFIRQAVRDEVMRLVKRK